MKLLILFIPLLFLFSCTDDQVKIEKLTEEVIAIHDEVMPKNIDINRVKRRLKIITQDTTLSEASQQKIQDQILQLTKADQAMTTWMAEYKPPSKDMSFDAAMKMLNEEKVKITEVKDLMLSSLQNGQNLLKEVDKPLTNKQ